MCVSLYCSINVYICLFVNNNKYRRCETVYVKYLLINSKYLISNVDMNVVLYVRVLI